MFATLCTGVGDQKRALTPQELKLPAIVSFLTWVLGTKLGSFRKAGLLSYFFFPKLNT